MTTRLNCQPREPEQTGSTLDPVCVSIRPSFLFIDVSVIGLYIDVSIKNSWPG